MLLTIQIAIFSALLAGIFPLFVKRPAHVVKFFSFFMLGISGVSAVVAGIQTLLSATNLSYQINSGFPGVFWQFKLDPLAGFFLAIIGLIVISIAIYGPGYMRSYEKEAPIGRMTFFTSLFIIGMYLVLLANDAFSFMLAWELMSIASYFLVAYHHEHTENRSAALIYLIMAHVSGLFILVSYGILIKFGGGYSFAAMHTADLTPAWASAAFLLSFAGFGMKAGIVPLHVWLPRAHPVAPSHISTLMSGIMLKVAIYGMLRFSFSLIKNLHWQWGVTVLIIGSTTALLGILYALMQHDLKKLLAYSSIENVGIIFIGIGLAIIFFATNHQLLGALSLIAALYHCLNHALFKSLLFLGAGAILQQSHEHDLEKMGGLIHKMPRTALFFLIGCISISAIPPFNGFVSEWLTFQAGLQATSLGSAILRLLIPVTLALLALTSALAAACFVKVYGVAFLGRARTQHVRNERDPSFGMQVAMGFLAFLCLVFGVLPVAVINIINIIPQSLVGVGLPHAEHWLWLAPLSANSASYSALLVGLLILFIAVGSYWLIKARYKKSQIRITNPWDCGFGGLATNMQYSATAFAMPIRRVFRGSWHVSETIDKTPTKIKYTLKISDWIWLYIYEPLQNIILTIARGTSRLQGGNVRVYLAYVFCTLIILLWVIA